MSKSHLKSKFKYKKLSQRPLKSTTTTIRRAFSLRVQPEDTATAADLGRALESLGMSSDDIRCIYCGRAADTWDHFSGLVSEKKTRLLPYSTMNFVPSCDKCNESRRSANWLEWIDGQKRKGKWWGDAATEAVRFNKLKEYHAKSIQIQELDPTVVFDPNTWQRYVELRETIITLLIEGDRVAAELDKQMADWIDRRKSA